MLTTIIWLPLFMAIAGIDSPTTGPATQPATQPASRPAVQVTKLTARDAEAVEAALRWWLERTLSREKPDTPIFISTGAFSSDWEDPPAGFLDRFNDPDIELRPVSKARLPKPGEMESPNRFRGVEDPETGRRSRIYWAEIIEWVSDTKVKVDTGTWSGPLGGGGAILVLERKDGKWVFSGMEDHWVS